VQAQPNVFVVADTVNVHLLRTGRDAILIDFGSGDVLDRLGDYGVDRVTDVLLTHHHRDVTQGLARAADAGVRIWVPPTERDLVAAADEHWQMRELDNIYDLREDRFTILDSVPIDGVVQEYRTARYGGIDVLVFPTPGHTPGTTAAVIPIHDNGRVVNMLVTGGSNMGNLTNARPYIVSVKRTYALAKAMNVEGGLHPHQFYEAGLQKIFNSGRTSPSQIVVGNDKYLRSIAVWRECTAAFIANLDATTSIPVWRASKTEFLAASPAWNRLSARVFNGWGPVAGQQVTFTVEGRGTACSAVTDATGVATCKSSVGPLKEASDKITASFEGGTQTGYVDLGSKVTELANNGCADYLAVKQAMGARAGDAAYVARLDVNQDGAIDGTDLSAITSEIRPGFCKTN